MHSSIIGYSKSNPFILFMLTTLLLTACVAQSPKKQATPPPTEAVSPSSYYLQQMQQSHNDNKADWQLLAIRALIREGQLSQANELVSTIPQRLSDIQQQEHSLIAAELNVAQNNTVQAATILRQLFPEDLSKSQKIRYYQLVIKSSQPNDWLSVVRAYIAQAPLLNAQQYQENIDDTWAILNPLPENALKNVVINANENVLQGWLELLRVYQENKQTPKQLIGALQEWQIRYPQNPAAKTLPTELNMLLNPRTGAAESIVLLLPLNNQAQVFAHAIQAGFEAARNGRLTPSPSLAVEIETNTNPATEADPTLIIASPINPYNDTTHPAFSPSLLQENIVEMPQPETNTTFLPPVKVYDTSSRPLPELLAQAQQEGATLVVGPLLKENVELLATIDTPLKILALNQPEQISPHSHFCYFALSPEDEARDAAKHIWEQGKRMPLILAPRGSLGNRVANAFTRAWRIQGGGVVLQQDFGSETELHQAINHGTGIHLTGQPVFVNEASMPESVTIAGVTISAPSNPALDPVPTPHQTAVDAVYIIATPGELTLINPMIELVNGSHSNLALYASSRSYQAGAGPDFRLEMEGIQFSETPLLAGSSLARQQASALFKNDYSLIRLYAMGADAWTLANHFNQLHDHPDFQLAGETGILSVDNACVINRKLPWLVYRQGNIVPLP